MSTIDTLPVVPEAFDREALAQVYLTCHKLKAPTINTQPNTLPYARAYANADTLLPFVANAKRTAESATLEFASGDAVATWGERHGVEEVVPQGATGSVTVTTTAGGATYVVGQECRNPKTSIRYRVTITATRTTGGKVQIAAVDPGPEGNLLPGVRLEWSQPPSGSATECVVFNDGGLGLTGGSSEQTTEAYKAAIQEALRNPAAAGNDADYQEAVRKTPGVPVEQCFTYPGIMGPGTIGIAFTVTVDGVESRVPSAGQIAAVAAWLDTQFPADDGRAVGIIDEEEADICFRVTWGPTVPGWFNSVVWPKYFGLGPDGAVLIDGAYGSTTATQFRIYTSGTYTGGQPEVGTVIGLWNGATRQFVRKEIASISGTDPWIVTVNETDEASDEAYVPVANQRVMPWSDSLNDCVAPVLAKFRVLGPGEQTAVFLDPGLRKKRSPAITATTWPSTITQSALNDALDLAGNTANHSVVEGDGTAATVGTPGIESNLVVLGDFAILPE